MEWMAAASRAMCREETFEKAVALGGQRQTRRVEKGARLLRGKSRRGQLMAGERSGRGILSGGVVFGGGGERG